MVASSHPSTPQERPIDDEAPHHTHSVDSHRPHDVFAPAEGGINFRTLTWPHASVIVAKLQIGIGILGIPGTFDTLGFAPGLISLLIICMITTYCGLLAGRIRLIHPELHSAQDLGSLFFGGSRIGMALFGFFYWVLLVMIAGSGILSTTIALNAISSHALCTMAFAGIVVAACLLIGGGCRQLMKVAWLGWAGIICVMISIWTLTIAMLTKDYPMASLGQTGRVQVKAGNSSSTFAEAMSAVTTQLFAILGNVAFYSISAEMKRPREFEKAVYVGQLFVIANYIIVGCIVYGKAGQFLTSPALGSAGPLIKKICYGFSLPAVLITAIMYSHLATKQVFVTALRSSRHLTTPTVIHWGVWIGSTILAVAIGFVLAASIPVFDDLLSLIGATVGCFFSIVVGGMTLLYMVSHEDTQGSVAGDDSSSSSGEGAEAEKAVVDSQAQQGKAGQTAARVTSRAHVAPSLGADRAWLVRAYLVAFKSHTTTRSRKVRFGLGVLLLMIGGFIIVGGTYGAAVSISNAYSSGAVQQAFSCADNSV
ncbi:hypothetical protein BDZ90DRAFT_233537 [Jaminaea rosea]|uniref:Amino acid transporter transmembrane domain-containing protein n=1 Tax=Jaminaea rosea TaxID=1569628 RepID=A0A316US29_9BASI|nr:hypothetical protein BDZ90DRAFT_233537 [Jaminaea rosea]PWN25935.1 hypothetical protein BDZ90DRAFT_233537 [Jaminaea rosea]